MPSCWREASYVTRATPAAGEPLGGLSAGPVRTEVKWIGSAWDEAAPSNAQHSMSRRPFFFISKPPEN
jgi:hypothetical protein